MPASATPTIKRPHRRPQAVSDMERWKLEDAKARLSEVVRLAATNGPQLVTVRGKEAAIILAPEEYRQLLPRPKSQKPLVEFLRGLGLDGLDLEREHDTGREITL
jgi:antitoxin Phd